MTENNSIAASTVSSPAPPKYQNIRPLPALPALPVPILDNKSPHLLPVLPLSPALPSGRSKPMREEYRAVLSRHHAQLSKDLDMTILPQLVQEGVFSMDQCEMIRSEKTRFDQINLMLSTLQRRGDDAFPKFLNALKDDFTFLHDMLTEDFEEEYDFYMAQDKLRRTVQPNFRENNVDGYYCPRDECVNVLREPTKAFVEVNETLVIKRDIEVIESGNSEIIYDRQTGNEVETPRKICLRKGEVVIKDSLAENNEENESLVTVLDVQGCCLTVPKECVQSYGDPSGEPWFFPREISSRQATLFLRDLRYEGAFMVYKSESRAEGVAFNLSVCRSSGNVIHYPIHRNDRREVFVRANKVFMSIQDLVRYYRKNRGAVCCRLRKCPRELGQPFTKNIPPVFQIDGKDVEVEGPEGQGQKQIGKGHYSSVVLGKYKGESVAVKIPKFEDGQISSANVIEEVEMMAMLQNDHILRFIGMSMEGQAMIVMEYMPEGDLLHWLRNNPSLDVPHVIRFGCQILSALIYLKQFKYIIHRDIAARNCLVAAKDIIKLADFGMARYVDDDEYRGEEGEKVPIRWAAIEVINSQTYSTQSDIWSVGVLLWELFTSGTMPFKGHTNQLVAQQVAAGGILEKPGNCPTHIFGIMKKCWIRNPKKRIQAIHLKETLRAGMYQDVTPKRRRLPSDDDSETEPYVCPSTDDSS